jgi:hypothetical protein
MDWACFWRSECQVERSTSLGALKRNNVLQTATCFSWPLEKVPGWQSCVLFLASRFLLFSPNPVPPISSLAYAWRRAWRKAVAIAWRSSFGCWDAGNCCSNGLGGHRPATRIRDDDDRRSGPAAHPVKLPRAATAKPVTVRAIFLKPNLDMASPHVAELFCAWSTKWPRCLEFLGDSANLGVLGWVLQHDERGRSH